MDSYDDNTPCTDLQTGLCATIPCTWFEPCAGEGEAVWEWEMGSHFEVACREQAEELCHEALPPAALDPEEQGVWIRGEDGGGIDQKIGTVKVAIGREEVVAYGYLIPGSLEPGRSLEPNKISIRI